MTMNKSDVIEQMEKSGKIMFEALEKGDYKTNNLEGKKLLKIFKLFENDLIFASDCISEMYNSGNVIVRTEAASYSLALGIDVNKAIKILNEISMDDSFGIYSLNAEMILRVWNKNRKITIR